MIIDAHGHLVPKALLDEICARKEEFPSVELLEKDEGSIAFSFTGKKPTRPVAPFLQNVDKRLAWLKEIGISKQVVGCWLDMFGYELPSDEGEAWARMINKHMLAVAEENPAFVPLACVPLQDGQAAATVMHEAADQGFRGIMIGTQPNAAGGVLDTDDLDPFWQSAHDLGLAVYIHPVFECGDNRVHDYGMANAVGRITDTLIAVSRLIFSGHIEKYNEAKIVVVTGGAALPYVVGRLRRNYQLNPDTLGNPDKALSLLYYDTILQDAKALRFMADIVGTDRIMMASDSPFPIGDPDPTRVVIDAGFEPEVITRINGGLAAKIFGLDGEV